MRPKAWCLLSCLAAADTGYVMTDSNIGTAVYYWLNSRSYAEATYGHISTWETGGVTDMSWLFCALSGSYYASYGCNTAASSFNEDISTWDTSGVTTMYQMFRSASALPTRDAPLVQSQGMATLRLPRRCELRRAG